MHFGLVEQLIRIAMYSGGSAVFGKSIADGDLYQAAIGGVVALGAFIWFWFRDRQVVEANAK